VSEKLDVPILEDAAAIAVELDAAPTDQSSSDKAPFILTEMSAESRSKLSAEQTPRSRDFVDPTRGLTQATGHRLSFEPAVIDACLELTIEHRLSLFTCPDDATLYSLAHTLAERMVGWAAREITFGQWAKQSNAIGAFDLIHPGLGGNSERQLVIVFGFQQGASDFFPLLPTDQNHHDYIRSRFGDTRRMVVLATPERLKGAGYEHLMQARYARPIDFLEPQLRGYSPDAWESLRDRVCQLQTGGLWGESESLQHERILAALRAKTLEAECTRREQALQERDPMAALRQAPAGIIGALAAGGIVETIALFVVAEFGPLRAPSFQRLVMMLLGPRRVSVGTTGSQLLSEQWPELRREVMSRCGLQVITGPPKVVNFAWVDVREQVLAALENDLAHDELCGVVDRAALVLDDADDVRLGALQLTEKRLRADPEGFVPAWTARLLTHCSACAQDADATAPDHESLTHLSEAQLSRVTVSLTVLTTMLLEKNATTAARLLLETMLQHQWYAATLELIERVTHIDFGWIQASLIARIIDTGSEAVRGEAYAVLARLVKQPTISGAGILRELQGWDDGTASPRATRSVQLLVELNDSMLITARPSSHALAATLAAASDEDLPVILDGLLRPPRTANDPRENSGELISTAFFWSLPRPMAGDLLNGTDWLWVTLYPAWAAALSQAVAPRFDVDAAPFRHLFATLVLSDLALTTLSSPQQYERLWQSIAAAVCRCSPKQRQAFAVLLRILDEGSLACLTVLAQAPPPVSTSIQQRLRERCRATRDALKKLLAETRRAPATAT
jgi:hypothetical protein